MYFLAPEAPRGSPTAPRSHPFHLRCCGTLGDGSMPLGMGENTCGSSAVLRLVDTKIDRRGRCVSADTVDAPADDKRDIEHR